MTFTYGMVTWQGKEIVLTHEVSLETEYHNAGQTISPCYQAKGVDAKGNKYLVVWSVVDNWHNDDEIQDLADAVPDWNIPWHVESL